MNRRHAVAIIVALLAMVAALAQPLWIRSTGTEVALELRPVDPLSLFRGNYVDLNYDTPVETGDRYWGDPVFVVFNDERPAQALRLADDRPTLSSGETCLQGTVRSSGRVGFPDLEQFFVTPEEGGRLERELGTMVGVIRATGSCRSILVGIERE